MFNLLKHFTEDGMKMVNQRIADGHCPICNEKVMAFCSMPAFEEFQRSGLCESCQRKNLKDD